MDNSTEIEKLVKRYKSERNWERRKEKIGKNASAVQLLAKSILEEGKAGTEEASALYFLCLINNVYSSEKKKSAIDGLTISAKNKREIKEYIDESTGIVGGPSFQVKIPEGNEQDFHELLSKFLNSDSKEERKESVKEFASKEISGIQSAKLSPILYFLRPKEFPINNNLSREGMEEYFEIKISRQLEDYVDEIKKYKKIRDKYNFQKNYRDLDFFFVWADQNVDGPQNHFWISVNPNKWRVSDLSKGEERFYTAYTKDLNKRKVFESFEKAQPGDKVIFYESGKVGKVVGKGEITKGLHTEEHENYDKPVESISFKYLDPIDGLSWVEIKEYPELENSAPVRNNAEGSIFELSKEEYEKLLVSDQTEKDILLDLHNSELDFSNFDPTENLHFPDDIKEEIETSISAALKSGKNIIFTGPPGTGKTKIAENVARQMAQGNECIDGSIFTTATADWTTFDTIGGYHPQKKSKQLEFKPGQFLNCFKGKSGKPINKWLIIDEINRADIDKAFGQLFSVLSKNNVELPFTNAEEKEISIMSLNSHELNSPGFTYDDSSYYVTRNWRLLATMNTYDKASLYEMSYAFMRRFAFIDVSVPTEDIESSLLKDYIAVWKDIELIDFEENTLDHLSSIWESLNKGKRAIGPAIIKDMLMFVKESEGSGIASALKLYVLPQLEGMVKQDQTKLIKDLSGQLKGNQKEILLKAAEERFEINRQKLKEELENE